MIDHPQNESEQRDSDLIFKKSNQTGMNVQNRAESNQILRIGSNPNSNKQTKPNSTTYSIFLNYIIPIDTLIESEKYARKSRSRERHTIRETLLI